MAIDYRAPADAVDATSVRTDTFAVGDVDPLPTQPHVEAPTGGVTSDSEARAAINSIRQMLADFGLMGPS